MTGPAVTVVTPCLNPGERLHRCIESVRAQTYADVEHLVIDAQSTDGTLDVLRRSGVRWVSEPDSGQSDAINKGFGLAEGSVLTWLNADDVLLPGAVAAAVTTLESDADWCYGDVRIMSPTGVTTLRPPPRLRLSDFAVTNPLPQPGTFFTRAAVTAVGPLDMTLHYSMDIDLWIRLLSQGLVARHVGTEVAVFEVHPQSKGGSVALSEFLLEAARAFVRNGHAAYAAAYVGRTAAHRAADRGGVTWSAVGQEIDALFADPEFAALSSPAVQASARAQAALLGARERNAAAAAQALRLDVWTDSFARALLTHRLRQVRDHPVRRRTGAASRSTTG